MKNFDFENFKYNYMAVHCNSQTELDDFIKQCEDNNVITGPDRGFDKNYGYIIVDSERLYCDYATALKNEDYEIIEWEIENKIDYDREYNIMEILEFPVETEFINEDLYIVKFKEGILQVKNKTKNSVDSWSKCLITPNWLRAEFKLVKRDKKVSFEEAIQAYGKEVYCIWNDGESKTEYRIESPLHGIRDVEFKKDITPEEILNGEWYIKED
ncbi:hypothetical protein EXN50_15560 [Clostridium botulinum]|nr:hypothetical protein [Clostridium botulinum]